MAATFGLYFKGMNQSEANAMRQRLNQIAAFHGYTSERGPTTGAGNAAELLQAIDSGEVAIVLLGDEQRSIVIRWLDEQSKLVEDIPLADALKNIADQLYAAVKREVETDEEELRSYLEE